MKLLVLALFIVGVHGCGRPTFPPILSRLVNRANVRANSWPWQVSLQYKRDLSYYHTCGGTLVSDQWVLTSAQCIGSRTYRVYLGKHSLNTANEKGSVAMDVERIIVHEQFDPQRSWNNIALIKLQSRVQLTDSIMPACLPENELVYPGGTPCFVTGWGRLWSGGPLENILQQALLPIVDHATCSRSDWWSTLVTEKMVCAGGDGEMASCDSDSGGPLNCQRSDGAWVVYGVVDYRYSVRCSWYKKPSIFTRVSAYIPWINNVMATY